jgi:hypothetical protein
LVIPFLIDNLRKVFYNSVKLNARGKMTNFTIKCETFIRLANICSFFSQRVDEETKNKINVLRLENHSGNLIAIITNQAIACIERIGTTSEKNSYCDVILDANLLNKIKEEIVYGSTLTINTIPEFAISTAQTTMGNQFNNCCAWYDDSPLNKWRSWGTENASKSVGAMYWELDEIEVLTRSSPTGKIVFPEFIDVNKPITLRDRYSDQWVGLFIPKPNVGEIIKQKAELPVWWRKS